ncbi:MAG: hypothetical protein A2275_18965 [Bacteroidetes bacterium RIFOXYA12_FULL_35_11]|nr:MAG: hypothetical protein A2X01_02340 [Bacteroidetes bacterium GWF2_35_48]OFY74467.1 MAG: hypothetical protein A2275_18965 [Bacteroidetes bacterium RIFOXYA12_FULL_35_11]OFY93909.1 MAG: hypothetical protein A2309_02645 [Bacteroidetes bacterium RIFOXYB2_FULL_35_7]OFY96516.1 MAG: hypothetical protein A2491_11740 [Bacteroidetes bacterium RIFOXYC12_FULL_35_7]HBX49732.1 hypothetical protein [Bacteroidales bacterium]
MKTEINEILLDEKDLKVINKKRNTKTILCIFFLVFFSIVCFGLYLTVLGIIWILLTGIAIIVGFGLLAFYLHNKSNLDLETGTKYVIKGIVKEKNTIGSEPDYYYVKIETQNIFVTPKQYEIIKINEPMEIHFTIHSKILLFMRKIN